MYYGHRTWSVAIAYGRAACTMGLVPVGLHIILVQVLEELVLYLAPSRVFEILAVLMRNFPVQVLLKRVRVHSVCCYVVLWVFCVCSEVCSVGVLQVLDGCFLVL